MKFRYGDVIQLTDKSWMESLKPNSSIDSSSDDRLDVFMDDPLLGIRSERSSVGPYVSNRGVGSSSKLILSVLFASPNCCCT